MSDEKQENSIARQRAQVEPYAAKNGYQIVKEYVDEGIPGDEERKRKAFMQMLAEAQQRQFQVILCDDKDRFARLDSINYGYYVKPLRDLGIKLVTVAQGVIKWDSFSARITDAVLQEAKKLESQATSRRVISRMLMMARQGKWLGGPVPYGYRLLPDPVLGKKLVPGDPAHVRVVQLIFRLYGDKGFSLDMIGAELYARAILNPRGGVQWHKNTLRKILRNRKYVGDQTWNMGHAGKYSEVTGGDIRTSDSRLARRTCNEPEDWIVVPDTHEPLVERELFERVQARLVDNRQNTSPAPKDRPYLLSGLLVCGACGWRMIGDTQSGKRYYKCGQYHNVGSRSCGCNLIAEERLVRCILQRIEATLLNPTNVARLRAEVQQKADHYEQARPVLAADLEAKLAELQAKIDPALERMALIPPDLLPQYGAMVRGWNEEHERLQRELERTQKARPDTGPDIDATVQKVTESLYRLREAVLEGDPVLAREFLRRLITKVELFFDKVQGPKRYKNVFRRGVIYVDPPAVEYLPSSSSTTTAGRRGRRLRRWGRCGDDPAGRQSPPRRGSAARPPPRRAGRPGSSSGPRGD
jgi:DNA invertase Pin-like site-specific DNA recombinase